MSGLAQGVLYVDSVFLVVMALLNVAFAYPSFRGAIALGELDIVATELERCLSKSSFVYWLIRGDLQFFNHQPTNMGWVDVVREYASYVVIVPFGVIFAKLLKARYGASLQLNVLFALLTYAAVFNVVEYAREQVRSAIASKTPCLEPAMQRAYSTYNQGLVVRQLAERINAEQKEKLPAGRAFSVLVDGNRLVLDTMLDPKELPARAQWYRLEARRQYCANTYFRLARTIQVPLKLIVRNVGGDVMFEEQFTRSDCES